MHRVIFLMVMMVAFIPGGCTVDKGKPGFAIPTPPGMAFGYYTLALTWQPGFCNGQAGKLLCSARQRQLPLIGLHGFWASEPFELERQNIPVTAWWGQGCGLYRGVPPALPWSERMVEQLRPVVPGNMATGLIQHEYEKHMRCFGMEALSVFTIASQLRAGLADGGWGRELAAHAGQSVRRADLLAMFTQTYGILPDRALQFRCVRDRSGESILVELWFSLKADSLALFPDHRAFLSSPYQQDNCPAVFRLLR